LIATPAFATPSWVYQHKELASLTGFIVPVLRTIHRLIGILPTLKAVVSTVKPLRQTYLQLSREQAVLRR
jgi:hypothetical protein